MQVLVSRGGAAVACSVPSAQLMAGVARRILGVSAARAGHTKSWPSWDGHWARCQPQKRARQNNTQKMAHAVEKTFTGAAARGHWDSGNHTQAQRPAVQQLITHTADPRAQVACFAIVRRRLTCALSALSSSQHHPTTTDPPPPG